MSPAAGHRAGSDLSTRQYFGWFTSGLLVALLGLTGCASLPNRGASDIPASLALPSLAQTRLARTASTAMANVEQLSAFKLLPIGSAAYQTLIELTLQAERSIHQPASHFLGALTQLVSDVDGHLPLSRLRAGGGPRGSP